MHWRGQMMPETYLENDLYGEETGEDVVGIAQDLTHKIRAVEVDTQPADYKY